LSFGAKYNAPNDIRDSVLAQLELIEHAAGLDPDQTKGAGPLRLQKVIYYLHQTTGQRVVILVDEYDKPNGRR